MLNNNLNNGKPFLRWIGGKRHLIHFLKDHLPPNFKEINRYLEPFLGAGSLFFGLKPSIAILSDNNKNLIECYKAVQIDPLSISKYLNEHLEHSNEKYYYCMREKYNCINFSIEKAALFIYLNKTCFNGIWRVNKNGKFNVPYGFKEPPSLPSEKDLVNASIALKKAKIFHMDYKNILNYIDKNDFVYFDPPYPALNGTSCFTHYTKERFNRDDHINLSKIVKRLNEKNCYILLSNADLPYIRSLYDDFNIFEKDVIRWVRSDGKRYKTKEIAITNYEL